MARPPGFAPAPTERFPCCRCGTVDRPRHIYRRDANAKRAGYKEEFLCCKRCHPLELKERQAVPPKRQSPMTPEQIAACVERLNRGNRTQQQRREAAKALAPVLSNRYLQVVFMYVSGMLPGQIAAALNYQVRTVHTILAKADIRAEIAKVQDAQRRRLETGEFGVQAMMKANATKFAETIRDQATYQKPDVHHREALKAAELGLKLSGDFVKKTIHEHLHTLIKGFTVEELEEYQRTKQWPDRFQKNLQALGIVEITATPVNGSGT